MPRREGVALCLSGGGFRSALFHLGALRRLFELGVLHEVALVSSVSGGSILSGFLADRIAGVLGVCDRMPNALAEGDLICEEWRSDGTHLGDLIGLAATGYPANMAGCNVIRLDANGEIASETTYTDAAGLYRQLHALPQLASAAG